MVIAVLPKLISTEDFYSFNVMPCMELDQNKKSSIISMKVNGNMRCFLN
jgi:hypothetical protein